MRRTVFVFLLCMFLLPACGPSGPSEEDIATQVAEQVAAQLTALAPSATAIPTDTPTSVPTDTPTPTATATPTPSGPSPTPTPTSTPTATPTDTPIPSPTPIPPTPTPKPPVYDGSKQNPYPLGMEGSVYDDWEEAWLTVSITQVIRGAEAWQQIQAANMFNDPPAAGNEYLTIFARIRYDQGVAGQSYDVNTLDFNYLDSGGRLLERPSGLVDPEPDLGDAPPVYEGGIIEGWLTFEIPAGDNSLLVAFGLDYRGRGGIWFSLR